MQPAQPAPTELASLRVTRNREIAPGVFLLSFERRWAFVPGQVVALSADPAGIPRLYSLCGGAAAADAEVLFDVNPGGLLTPALAKLRPGDCLWCSAPFGTFRGRPGPAWWIATGTGIAPFLSMLRSGLGAEKRLIHGARTIREFHFSDEFSGALGERYIRCCSREGGPGVVPGRLTAYLSALADVPRDGVYQLCGHSEMVAAVRELLLGRGVPFENIDAEIYF